MDWYGLEMPRSDKKDILYQWFDLNHIEKFDSFVRDLVMIEELKDCINELSYPISEKRCIMIISLSIKEKTKRI